MEKKLYFTPTVEKITVEASELLANSKCSNGNSKQCSATGESCGQGSNVPGAKATNLYEEDIEPATTNWSIWDEEL
ncbi:MAG: hypothetical protein ACI3YF_08545 [Prevotella sp.]